MKITKQSFIRATYRQLNEIREFNGILIAVVGWHTDRSWKIVKDNDFDLVSDRAYKPIKEFRVREDLWEYIKIMDIRIKITELIKDLQEYQKTVNTLSDNENGNESSRVIKLFNHQVESTKEQLTCMLGYIPGND